MVSAMPVIQFYEDSVNSVQGSGHRAAQPAPLRRCISYGAEVPAPLEEGQGLP